MRLKMLLKCFLLGKKWGLFFIFKVKYIHLDLEYIVI